MERLLFCCFYNTQLYCTNCSSFFSRLKVLWSRVLEPVSLTELVVVLINIMYQQPGPLPTDTLQTGGVGTLAHSLLHINQVIDFGLPPWFLVSLNKRTLWQALRKYFLLPALSLMCHRWYTALLRSAVISIHPEAVINAVINGIGSRRSFTSLLRQTTPDSGAFSSRYFMDVWPAD